MDDYTNLKLFWDNTFLNVEIDPITQKWCNEESFNNLIKEYIHEGDKVLDYGCGAGWASFEVYLTVPKLNILGVDQSINAIDTCNKYLEMSNLSNVSFEVIDEAHSLDDYQFDCLMSFNVIDVLPDDIDINIFNNIKRLVKSGGYLLFGINPDYPKEFLESIGYSFKDKKMYKNDIMRANDKSIEEWIQFCSQYFDFVETREFCISEREQKYPRRMLIFKNR